MVEWVFWDTWAYLALIDRRSNGHEIASAVTKQLRQQHKGMLTTTAILSEVGDAFSKQHLRRFALRQR